MEAANIALLGGGLLALAAGVTGAFTGAYLMIPNLSVAGVTDATGALQPGIGTQYLGTFDTPWYTGTASFTERMGYNYTIYTGKSFAAAGIQPQGNTCNPTALLGFTGLPSSWGCLSADANLLSIWAYDGNGAGAAWRFGIQGLPDYLMIAGAAMLLFYWYRNQYVPIVWRW